MPKHEFTPEEILALPRPKVGKKRFGDKPLGCCSSLGWTLCGWWAVRGSCAGPDVGMATEAIVGSLLRLYARDVNLWYSVVGTGPGRNMFRVQDPELDLVLDGRLAKGIVQEHGLDAYRAGQHKVEPLVCFPAGHRVVPGAFAARECVAIIASRWPTLG